MVAPSKWKMKNMFLFSMPPEAITMMTTLYYWNVSQFQKEGSTVHEIHYGVMQEHVCTQVNNITVLITEGMPVVSL